MSLPPEAEDSDEAPTFILASRLQPAGHDAEPLTNATRGVQQILLLPGPGRASILCNNVVSFYSLPELSPVFPRSQPAGVQWIGGIDENADLDSPDGQVIMIANARKILMAKIAEKLTSMKNDITYSNCLRLSRRDTIACVADHKSYALLEVEKKAKIPLFPISTLPEAESALPQTVLESLQKDNAVPTRSTSLAHRGSRAAEAAAHSRSTSLGDFVGGLAERAKSPRGESRPRSALRKPDVRAESRSPAPQVSPERVTTPPNVAATTQSSTTGLPPGVADILKPDPRKRPQTTLSPHVISPSSSEFLVVTGTSADEPAAGMFVSTDGDIVRGTLVIRKYPRALVLDKQEANGSIPSALGDDDGSVLALVEEKADDARHFIVDSFSLSRDPSRFGQLQGQTILPRSSSTTATYSGLSRSLSRTTRILPEVGESLKLVRLDSHRSLQATDDTDPRTSQSLQRLESEQLLFEGEGPAAAPAAERKRNAEEAVFARSLSQVQSNLLSWSGAQIWRMYRAPLLLQLDAPITTFFNEGETESFGFDGGKIMTALQNARKIEPQTETDFRTLTYIKQKASLLMLFHAISEDGPGKEANVIFPHAENALIESLIDPRIILLMVSLLKDDVAKGAEGIWLAQGLLKVVQKYAGLMSQESTTASADFYMFLRRYLSAWQEKRGFGSIQDERLVFESVDLGLLHILLHLETIITTGSSTANANRTKLNNVVDNWKGPFEAAVVMLERYQRLFVLSRLYQSKKQVRDVLRTWQRIAEGETDSGRELAPVAVEEQIKTYLVKIKDPAIVEEYGIWLAARNSTLAIQLFTDDDSKVKFPPQRMTQLLKQYAPAAVQQYLEYLVFDKGLTKYADDLIGYYLDSVLNVLENSADAKDSLAQSYSTYRALQPPKPTYLTFITENAPSEPWWQSRLRLLQLLSGGAFAVSGSYNTKPISPGKSLSYNIDTVLERLSPFSSYLVSESIILDARQGRHKEALRLLVHGLGDHDTAIRHCYFGGPTSSNAIIDADALPSFEYQSELFRYLFLEFLQIEDPEECLERTSQLAGKFAGWLDPMEVLSSIPEDWPLSHLSEFLTRTIRKITTEKAEAMVIKALSASQNLQKQAEFIDICEKMGAKIENADEDMAGSAPSVAGIVNSLSS